MDWITCADPDRERWRNLLEFANKDIALQALERIHGPPGAHRANYIKQATQIRVALLQAREYFAAAEESTPFTAANHLYYGAMSLASAIMLAHGNGTYSLDYLRKDPSNRNHGLAFGERSTAARASSGVTLLNDAFVSLRSAGHFKQWYSSLPTVDSIIGTVRTRASRENLVSTSLGTIGVSELRALDELPREARSIMSILERLPDLMSDLRRFGVRMSASRATIGRLDDLDDPGFHETRFQIHSAQDPAGLEEILWRFSIHHEQQSKIDCRVMKAGALVEIQSGAFFKFPDVRMTIDGDSVIYASEDALPEMADAYCASFGLSMLSRYFPDYWIACLESHCVAAKIIERFVDIYVRKFPMLALWYLRGPIVHSTQAAPYFAAALW